MSKKRPLAVVHGRRLGRRSARLPGDRARRDGKGRDARATRLGRARWDLEALLGRASDGIFAVRADGRIALWNRSAERILGYPAREVIGRLSCEVFLGRDDTDGRLCYRSCHSMRPAECGAPVHRFDVVTRTKAGESVSLDVNALAVAGTRGEWLTIVHVFRDFTGSRGADALVRPRRPSVRARADEGPGAGAALTRRELEVLGLVAGGAGTKAIAERLRVSPATVRNHVQNILGKLGVHSRLEAVAHVIRHRLLTVEGLRVARAGHASTRRSTQ